MKMQTLYNASDFPLSFRLTVPPNSGLRIEDLLELIREHGEYIYLWEGPLHFDENRVQSKSDIKIGFD